MTKMLGNRSISSRQRAFNNNTCQKNVIDVICLPKIRALTFTHHFSYKVLVPWRDITVNHVPVNSKRYHPCPQGNPKQIFKISQIPATWIFFLSNAWAPASMIPFIVTNCTLFHHFQDLNCQVTQ